MKRIKSEGITDSQIERVDDSPERKDDDSKADGKKLVVALKEEK